MLRPERNFLRLVMLSASGVLEIAADVVVRLHSHDIRAISEQKQVVRNLQVMRSVKSPPVKKPTGFSLRGSAASRIVTPLLNMWPT